MRRREHRGLLALVVVAALALGGVVVGVIVLSRPDENGVDGAPTPRLFSGQGVTFRFPGTWMAGAPQDQFGEAMVSAGMTQTVAYASDRPFQPACHSTKNEIDCDEPSMRGREVLAEWTSGLVDGSVLTGSTPMVGGPGNARWYEGPPLGNDCSGAMAYEMVMTIVQLTDGNEVTGVQMRACLRKSDRTLEGQVRDMATSVELD